MSESSSFSHSAPTHSAPTHSASTKGADENSAGYSIPSRALHWIVAGGIVLQYLLGERAEEAADTGALALQLASLAQHKSIGITVLVLVLARLLLRLRQTPPPLPLSYRETSPALAKVSAWTHGLLYLLLLFLPISGWLMSSASAYSVSWFGLITLPDLIGANESAKETLQSAHHLAAKILFVLALLHIAAAFKHLFIDKSGVMGRMASTATVSLFAATLTAGVWFTWPSQTAIAAQTVVSVEEPVTTSVPEPTPEPAPEPLKEAITEPTTASATPKVAPQDLAPPLWNIDPAESYIRFTAVQAGAEFTGSWQRFNAAIKFDQGNLADSRAVVTIDATSVATKDSERDSTLAGADWFDTSRFAEVVFTADEFEPLANAAPYEFIADASLSIRGADYPIQFMFSVQRTTGQNQTSQITLIGEATLDRLNLNLGTLEWADTEWVGQHVEVSVKVVATTP